MPTIADWAGFFGGDLMHPYFLAGLNVADRDCLVIGGDEEVVDKALKLAAAGARVRLVVPTLTAETAYVLSARGVQWIRKTFEPADLKAPFLMVLSPLADEPLVKEARRLCSEKGILLCAMDRPESCDIANLSLFERGWLKIGVSTSGVSPAAAKKIRQGLEVSLKAEPLEEFFRYLADLRAKLAREIKDKRVRRQKLIEAVADFEFSASVKWPAGLKKKLKASRR